MQQQQQGRLQQYQRQQQQLHHQQQNGEIQIIAGKTVKVYKRGRGPSTKSSTKWCNILFKLNFVTVVGLNMSPKCGLQAFTEYPAVLAKWIAVALQSSKTAILLGPRFKSRLGHISSRGIWTWDLMHTIQQLRAVHRTIDHLATTAGSHNVYIITI